MAEVKLDIQFAPTAVEVIYQKKTLGGGGVKIQFRGFAFTLVFGYPSSLVEVIGLRGTVRMKQDRLSQVSRFLLKGIFAVLDFFALKRPWGLRYHNFDQ